MEPEGSLPHSQESATCPYPEPDKSSPHLLSLFLKIYFYIIVPSTSRSCKSGLSFSFPHQDPVCLSVLLMRTTRLSFFRLLVSTTPITAGQSCWVKWSGTAFWFCRHFFSLGIACVDTHYAEFFWTQRNVLAFVPLRCIHGSEAAKSLCKSTGENGMWRWGVTNYPGP